jgi:hypothetical protein
MASTYYLFFDRLTTAANKRMSLWASNAVYLNAHNGAGAVTAPATADFMFGQLGAVGFEIWRSRIGFNCALINGLTPISGRVIFYNGNQFSVNASVLCVVDGSLLSNPLINADYANLLASVDIFGSIVIAGADPLWMTLANQATQKAAVLNALGLAAINVAGGTTSFGIRSLADINVTLPVGDGRNTFGAASPNTVFDRFVQSQSVTNISDVSALVSGRLTPWASGIEGWHCNPVILQVDVAEGSGTYSNYDTRLVLWDGAVLTYSPWFPTQAPFVDFSYNFTGLRPSTDYTAYVEWRFNHAPATVYNSDVYSHIDFTTRPLSKNLFYPLSRGNQ